MIKKNSDYAYKLIVITVSVCAALVTNFYIQAWTPPTANPMGGISPGLNMAPWFVAAGSAAQSAWVTAAEASWTYIMLNDAKGRSAANYNPANGRFTAPETGLYYCFMKQYKQYSTATYHHEISTCWGPSYTTTNVCNQFISNDYTLGGSGGTSYDDGTGKNEGLFWLAKDDQIAWRTYSRYANAAVYYPQYTREGCVLVSY